MFVDSRRIGRSSDLRVAKYVRIMAQPSANDGRVS